MSSAAPRPPRRTRRALPVLVAVAVGAAAVTVVIDIVAVAADDRTVVWPAGHLAHDLRTTAWTAGSVLATGLVVGIVGLALLAHAVLPGRRVLRAIVSEDPTETVGLTRQSLARAIRADAESVSGVDTASVRVRRGGRRAEVRIGTAFRDAADLPGRVDEAVGQGLDAIRLARRPSVRASLAPRAEGDAG